SLSAQDDLGITDVALEWFGYTQHRTYAGGQPDINESFTVRDPRNVRVNGSVTEPLRIRVTDTLGQVTEQSVDIVVNQDLPPDASQLAIAAPANGFFNTN